MKPKPHTGGLESKTFETGLDTISFSKLGTIYLPSWPEGKTIKTILSDCSAIMADETKPEHVRYLATMTANLAQDLIQQLPRGGCKPEAVEAAQTGILLGIHVERLALWESERPATAGRRSRAAAQRKDKAIRRGSLLYFFEHHVPDWLQKSRGSLLMLAIKEFPGRDEDSLLRKISTLKKGGR